MAKNGRYQITLNLKDPRHQIAKNMLDNAGRGKMAQLVVDALNVYQGVSFVPAGQVIPMVQAASLVQTTPESIELETQMDISGDNDDVLSGMNMFFSGKE